MWVVPEHCPPGEGAVHASASEGAICVSVCRTPSLQASTSTRSLGKGQQQAPAAMRGAPDRPSKRCKSSKQTSTRQDDTCDTKPRCATEPSSIRKCISSSSMRAAGNHAAELFSCQLSQNASEAAMNSMPCTPTASSHSSMEARVPNLCTSMLDGVASWMFTKFCVEAACPTCHCHCYTASICLPSSLYCPIVVSCSRQAFGRRRSHKWQLS